ncbi:MAG: hypothetical protein ABFD94_04765 [Armatimonadia bacterium]
MNRPAFRIMVVTLILAAVGACLLAGCQRSATPQGQAQQTDTNSQILQELRQYQEATGKNLAMLAEEVKRRQTLDAEKAGDPPVVRDLAVARDAVTEAQKAVEAHDAVATKSALDQLKRVLQSLDADLPGRAIVRNVDRAVYQIRTQQSIGSKEFPGATQELLMASDAGVSGRPAELVPDVLKEIETARASTARGDGASALQTLNAVLQKPIPGGATLDNAQAAARGAEDSLQRLAWPVVAAELTEIGNLLKSFALVVAPEKAAPAATEETPAATSSTTTPPAATPTQPVTPTQQPAATTQPMPQPAPQPTTQPAPVQQQSAPVR